MTHSYRPLTSINLFEVSIVVFKHNQVEEAISGLRILGPHKVLCGADRSASELEHSRYATIAPNGVHRLPSGMRAREARGGLGDLLKLLRQFRERLSSSSCVPNGRVSVTSWRR